VNFVGTNLGVDATNQVRFTTAPTLDPGGLIGGWALYNATTTSADFATYGANSVAVANSNTDTTGASWNTASNLKFTTGTITVPATGQVNSLNLSQTAATTVDLNGFTGRIGSGGVLVTGAFASTISNGALTAGQANNTAAELIFTVLTNTSTVSANIVDNGTGAVSLTKLGGGNLVLSGTNTFSGPVVSTGGTLTIGSDTALGNTTSVTMRQTPTSVSTNTFALSGGRNVGTGVTLSLESLGLGGIIGSAAGPAGGVVGRAQIQALGAGTTNTWNGTIALSGNNFPIATAAAGITLNLNGPIVAGPGGFQGNLLVRGGGNTNINGSVNLPQGGLATTDGGTVLTINQPTSGTNNWASTNAYAGTIQLGANNVLPPTAVLNIGQNQSGNLGTFSMNGFNATVAGLNISPGSTAAAASQIVQNNAAAGSNSTLTFAGNATPSTFTGTIRDGAAAGTLAVNLTAGTLTLSGANAYSGGTTIGQTSTLLVNNASGSGTGTGPVIVSGAGGPANGGTLGGTGTISGPVTVNTIQGSGTIAPGVGGIGTLTLGNGLTLNGVYRADVTASPTNASDLIAVTGNVNLTGSTLNLPGSNTYAPLSANFTYTLMTFTGTLTGTFSLGSPLPAGYMVVYTGNSVQLMPVPEPATILAIAVSAYGFVCQIRRRRGHGEAVQTVNA
jgi:autotransporter-associated beta strand protein